MKTTLKAFDFEKTIFTFFVLGDAQSSDTESGTEQENVNVYARNEKKKYVKFYNISAVECNGHNFSNDCIPNKIFTEQNSNFTFRNLSQKPIFCNFQ